MTFRLETLFTRFLLVSGLVATVIAVGSACGGDDSADPLKTPEVPTIAQPGAQPTTPAGTAGSTTATTSGISTVGPAQLVVVTIAGKQVLTDVGGFTLYTFDRDTPNDGKSACNGVCANVWRPVLIAGAPPTQEGLTGTVAFITRRDGTTQLTYNGRPLYRYMNDVQPGDAVGDGNGGIWHAATP